MNQVDRTSSRGRRWITTAQAIALALAGAAPMAALAQDEKPTASDTAAANESAQDESAHRERRGDGEHPHREWQMSSEYEQELLSVLRDVNPRFADRLTEGLKENSERSRAILRRMAPRMHSLMHDKDHNPELYALKVSDQKHQLRAFELAMQIRQAREQENAQEADKLTAELREQLQSQFDVRQQIRERELIGLQQRIEALRESLDDHRERKAELIDAQLQEFLTREHPWRRRDRRGNDDDDDGNDQQGERPTPAAADEPREE